MRIKYLLIVGFCTLILDCGPREIKDRTYTPGWRAKAVGVAQAAQEGAGLLAESEDSTITVSFLPKVDGPYSVAVIPATGFRAGLLEKAGISERVALKMEKVLYRFGHPQSTIVFHKEGRHGVSSTTSHNRFLTVPRLLTAEKGEGGVLRITLAKGTSGQISMVGLD